MDTLSHALIGLTVAGLSGHPATLHDPVYTATLLGSQLPDFDFVFRAIGYFPYLKQHRYISHSFVGLVLCTSLTAFCLQFFFPGMDFFVLAGWLLAGAFSHIFTDTLNTHGAALLWPFYKHRVSISLIPVCDPWLILLLSSSYCFPWGTLHHAQVTLGLLGIYTLTRLLWRIRIKIRLHSYLATSGLLRSSIMPSLHHSLSWDYVAETTGFFYTGHFHSVFSLHQPGLRLEKPQTALSIQAAQKTCLGTFFLTFSPYIHTEEHIQDKGISLTMYDLRYNNGSQFLHSATIFLNHKLRPQSVVLTSYGNKISIPN